ncbi:bifunctional metallophosphatase/5'-nucleotidase [Mangrovactinospora gilvigrisea]|uniref:Bifunctional metallophosphatase/5'-nucleotidase n=1 Tax=Mangrovactinospora gilvigrisea TaxID=1428644 RepID=A0A1J7BCB6_9ACTN|nr:5'-nucleotidase C-terminal domain-containing protein [Mangrovactinospora gilvigrisea]OIV36286.1 bifunctional metallophosphatase/5'-nucleotidase [Mangrovactinospora gilvigrisea]
MSVDRRTFLKDSALASAALATAGGTVAAATAPAAAADTGERHGGGAGPRTATFTVLGTTDLHSHVLNWDYDLDAAYSDKAGDEVGIAKIATLVERQRALKGRDRTLLIDAGDIIQGTLLAYYYARVDPITNPHVVHPMAAAMNHMKYDAAALGNHEFNYGIPVLRRFQSQLDFPLLGANALDAATLKPAFPPFTIKRIDVPGRRPIRVGILGLTNPGIALWDHDNVTGRMEFPGLVEQAKLFVPELRKHCDVVFLTDHSGLDGSTSYGDEVPYPENASNLVAENVPGIDAILVGHTHVEVAQKLITNSETGKTVVLSEPYCFGKRLSVFDFALSLDGQDRWQVDSIAASVLNSSTAEEDPEVVRLLAPSQAAVRAYGNTEIGANGADMPGTNACWEETALVDFIQFVQLKNVKAGLTGDAAALPLISVAAPFSRLADVPTGTVRIRNLDGLYPYDNTLYAKKLTGAQLKAYLEFAAKYYHQVPVGTAVDTSTLTNANSMPDFSYDMAYGVSYEIDIAAAEGSRISGLTYQGAAVADDQVFVVAVNNYRASGGSGYPFIYDAETVWSTTAEVRQMMIDYVKEVGTLDPAVFTGNYWKLTQGGTPVFGS